MEICCNIIHVLTVTFDQFNVSLLNKSINFPEKGSTGIITSRNTSIQDNYNTHNEALLQRLWPVTYQMVYAATSLIQWVFSSIFCRYVSKMLLQS